MKKIFTLLSMLSISGLLLAQSDTASNASNWVATPNPGFEGWTAHSSLAGSYNDPNGWHTANSQTATVGIYGVAEGAAYKGTYSAQLTTQSVLGNIAPGIVTTGTIPTSISGSISGGIAYTLRPDSIVGWFKYTPKNSDYCFAAMYLFGSAANNADTVAEAFFSTTAGTTVSNWTRFAAVFKYRNTDPVANSIWLVSSSGGTSGAQAGSVMYVDELAVILPSTVGIASVNNTSATINVYPNPANDHITVESSLKAGAQIAIYDVTGRKVAEQELKNGNNNVDVNSFVNGLYIYTVIDVNGSSVKTGKIIVQK